MIRQGRKAWRGESIGKQAHGVRGAWLHVSYLAFFLLCAGTTVAQTGGAFQSRASTRDLASTYREKIWVQTDQSWYVSGDILWCSVFLASTQSTQTSPLSSVAYIELLDATGKPAWQAMVRIDSGLGQASWKIPSTLATGVYMLRSYTRWMRNQPVDHFFHQPILLINPQRKPDKAVYALKPTSPLEGQSLQGQGEASRSLSVETDSSTYGMRAAVRLTVETRNGAGKSVPAKFCVSVVRVSGLPEDTASTFFGRELHNMTYHAGETLPVGVSPPASTGPEVRLTDHPAWKHLPEIDGPVVSVTVQHKRTGKPVPGVLVCLSVPGTRFQTRISRSDMHGKARFALEHREGSGVLAFSFLDAVQDSLLVAPEPMFEETVSQLNGYADTTRFYPKAVLDAMLPEAQLFQAYGHTSQGPMRINPNSDTTAFYGKPDRAYLLDDYVRFASLEEVFREFVREVEVRKNEGIRVLNAPMRSFFTENPLVLLDGVPVRDVNHVMRIDPLKLRSIAVVTRRFYLGGQGFPGILILRTYNGDMGGTELPGEVLVTEYGGLLPPYTFSAPDYSTHRGSRIPDLRRTLFWSPRETCDGNDPTRLLFYTGDIPGRYLVEVNAFTDDGWNLRQTRFFEVR